MTDLLPSLGNALADRYPAAIGVLRFAGRTAGRALARVSGSSLPGPDGVIDFQGRRSLYSCGAFWRLLAAGREYVGQPGAWEMFETEGMTEQDPFWLLALVETVHEATAGKHEVLRGVTCERYRGLADFYRAHGPDGAALIQPLHADEQDLSRLPIEVWVDPAGRIRQAILWGPRESQTRIELSDYGEPGPLALPAEHEIVPEAD